MIKTGTALYSMNDKERNGEMEKQIITVDRWIHTLQTDRYSRD